ncbi:MAG: hypothetical protein KA444_01340 [Bacteroidia bacterium]|nr:hypothetical protein [Bacteroidia bacterium]
MTRNQVKLLQSGEDFFSRLELLIASANREIHIQTYILEPDQTGRRILEALKTASMVRKVKVYLVVDSYGSEKLNAEHRQELKDAGIYIKRFGKLYSRGKFHISRRLHLKIVVIDGEKAIVGGINLSNKYTDLDHTIAWLDFAVEVEGNAVRRLLLICRKRWLNARFRSVPKKLRDGILNKEIPKEATAYVKVSLNDFIHRKNEIAISYRNHIKTCSKSLTLVGGYFLPGGRIRRLLKAAANRGVEIKIIVSENSDVKLLLLARRFLYSWLLRHKIQIYEYQPSNVHGKVLISDKKHVSIGSYDLNNLSTYSNIELNLEISDETFASDLNERLEKIMSNECRLVVEQDYRRRTSLSGQFLSWLSFQIVKTFFVLSLIFARRSE